MPLPEFQFEDAGAGLPRHPVPVRFACMAANWSPKLFVEIVLGRMNDDQPLITVYELNTTNGYSGAVHTEVYERHEAKLSKMRGEALSLRLEELPENHYIWSDELVLAQSDHIDLAIGRESATGMGIIWQPGLGECYESVNSAVDLSSVLSVKTVVNNTITVRGKIVELIFNGQKRHLRASKPLDYIRILLTNPNKEFPLQDLHLIVNPPLHEEVASISELIDGDNLNTGGINITDLGDAGNSIDSVAIAQLKERLTVIDELIDDARERGNSDKQLVHEEEREKIVQYLVSSTNSRGRPRRDGSIHEKMRKSIFANIDRGISEVRKVLPALAVHLDESIKTGSFCSYTPSEPTTWSS